jgi:hypothetical protein
MENGTVLEEASSENPNLFLSMQRVASPIIKDPSQLKGVKPEVTFLCDIQTKPGETVRFISVNN